MLVFAVKFNDTVSLFGLCLKKGLEHAIAGTALHVTEPDDDIEAMKEQAMEDMESVLSRIDKSGEGVYVQASTLGSLEALLEFLKSPAVKILVSGIGIGPVHKTDIFNVHPSTFKFTERSLWFRVKL